MVEQVPGTAKGPGAVGEYETEGGELGSVPAVPKDRAAREELEGG
jgi:hypothetical protein